jgi:hypothetical protein
MPRARNIKPGLFTDEDLAECEPIARLLFIGLWCLADCEGRLGDRPKRIKATLLPYDDGADVDAMLGQLHDSGNIIRYKSEGSGYIWIPGFAVHQNPHKNERDKGSEIPPFTEQLRIIEINPEQSRLIETNHADSLILIPDSLILKEDTGGAPAPESESLLDSEKTTPKNGKAKKPKSKSIYELSFDLFWDAWPEDRRQGRKEALAQWLKLKPDGALAGKIIAVVNALKVTPDWKVPKYIKHAWRWIRDERWNDQVVTAEDQAAADLPTLKERIAKHRRGRENESYHTTLQSVGTDDEIWDYERDQYDEHGFCPNPTGRWHKDKPPAKWSKDRNQTEEARS